MEWWAGMTDVSPLVGRSDYQLLVLDDVLLIRRCLYDALDLQCDFALVGRALKCPHNSEVAQLFSSTGFLCTFAIATATFLQLELDATADGQQRIHSLGRTSSGGLDSLLNFRFWFRLLLDEFEIEASALSRAAPMGWRHGGCGRRETLQVALERYFERC